MRAEILRSESLVRWLRRIGSGDIHPGCPRLIQTDEAPDLEAARILEDGLPLPRLCLYYDGEYRMVAFKSLFLALCSVWHALEAGDVPWTNRSRAQSLRSAIECASVDVLIIIDKQRMLNREDIMARYRRLF